MTEDFLVFDGVVSGYGDTMVLRGISGRIQPGQVLGVLGRNGVGKSTLAKTLAGFLPVARGSIRWQGRDLVAVAPHARLGAGIAYAPQENVVFGDLTVADNLWLHLPDRRPDRYEAILEAFPRITERLRQRAGSLSGGERKLLSFARTLGLQSVLHVLDEPTEGVQPENIDRMAELIQARKRLGHGFLIVEQNLSFLESVADDVIVLDHGEAVLAGGFAELGRERLERYLLV